jgi:hypothetical protein
MESWPFRRSLLLTPTISQLAYGSKTHGRNHEGLLMDRLSGLLDSLYYTKVLNYKRSMVIIIPGPL